MGFQWGNEDIYCTLYNHSYAISFIAGLDCLLDKDWRGRGFDQEVNQLIRFIQSNENTTNCQVCVYTNILLIRFCISGFDSSPHVSVAPMFKTRQNSFKSII